MLRKTATIVLSPLGAPDALQKTAHRHVFAYTPRHGYLYVRSRMISSRCNDNYDEFPAEEIAKGWRSFIGKPVFVNHHNEDHRKMRGVIIDAALHEDFHRDGAPDTWVEGLMEIDALRYPKLAEAIVKRHIERTSMGVDVEHSKCSACGNVATTPLEYCAHVPGMKGRKFFAFTASGDRVGKLVYETCYGLNFFENSLLVEDPADPTAYFLGDIEFGPGLSHLHAMHAKASVPALARTASKQAKFAAEWPPGRPMPMRVDPRMLVDSKPIQPTSSLKLVQASRCEACRCRNTVADPAGNAECVGCGFHWHEAAKMAMLRAEAAAYEKPEDHPFFQEHPVHAKNIVDHWKQATDNEKAQGMRWYEDAHHIAQALGEHASKQGIKHPHGNTHLASGVLANHSPQNGWESNMHDAGRVMHTGKGIGGPGSGVFASAKQKENDEKMLAGAHYNDVLRGPKIRDFAHLIEHAGDEDPTVPHVVVDRHALSVAAGHTMTDKDYASAPMNGAWRKDGSLNRRYYDHVVGTYHEAARQISEKEGEPVAGHQVQAVTWLVRQRLNQRQEQARAEQEKGTPRSNATKGRERARGNAEQRWRSFREQHGIGREGPGTGYEHRANRARLAYGETKAPAKVDTLRDENCPVCGEQDAWDGNECMVCQYVAPPKQFQDPDLDKAKQLDLRQEQQAYDDSIQPKQVDEFGAEGDIQPELICPECGETFEAGEPETTDTEDPQMGDMGVGPAEGDVCPACGKGQLISGTEAAELGIVPPDEENEEGEVPPGEDEDTEADPEDPGVVDPRDLVGDEDPEDGSEEEEPEEEESEEDDESDDDKPAKKGKNPFKG